MLSRFAPPDPSAGASLFRFESITSPRGYHLHVRNYRRKANPTGNKLTTTRDNFKQNHTFKTEYNVWNAGNHSVCSSGPSIDYDVKIRQFPFDIEIQRSFCNSNRTNLKIPRCSINTFRYFGNITNGSLVRKRLWAIKVYKKTQSNCEKKNPP